MDQPRRLVAAEVRKSHWLATVLKAYDGRSATEAIGGSPVTMSRNQGAKIPDGRLAIGRRACIEMSDGAARGTPYLDRRKKRENYRRDRTGSALAPMWGDVSAELGRHGC